MMRFAAGLIFFVFAFPFLIQGQSDLTLELKTTVQDRSFLKSNYQQTFKDKRSREKELRKVLLSLQLEGYLLASVDSLAGDSIRQIAWISPGEKYTWLTLRKGNADPSLLSAGGFREKDYREKAFRYSELSKMMEAFTVYAENNGYPFIESRLDSVTMHENKISATLNISKGLLIFMDSIIVKGNSKISPAYLYNHIGIRPGDPYSEKKVKDITARLKEIPFAFAPKPFSVVFTKEKTKLIIWLDKKKASQFDGIVGILPDNKTKKTTITGDVRLKLLNAAGRGELIDFNWRKLQDQTQDLRARLNYPFLFRTNYCVDLAFKLYKRDTTFLEVNPVLGIEYRLSGKSSLKAFADSKTLSLLSTTGLQGSTVTPQNADVNTLLYGLNFNFERLDYRFNPREGFTFSVTAKAGTRRIIKNQNLNDSAYLQVDLSSSQYKGEGEIRVFVPLAKRAVLKVGLSGAGLLSDNIFQNELYRIGGSHSLRGFDEESIKATSYLVSTLELRYLLEQNSYAFLFAEAAWYENASLALYNEDMPYSFGTGISFETRAGILSLGYALGSQKNNPILFRNGKIHVGIVGLF